MKDRPLFDMPRPALLRLIGEDLDDQQREDLAAEFERRGIERQWACVPRADPVVHEHREETGRPPDERAQAHVEVWVGGMMYSIRSDAPESALKPLLEDLVARVERHVRDKDGSK